jgi:hypothetical protein
LGYFEFLTRNSLNLLVGSETAFLETTPSEVGQRPGNLLKHLAVVKTGAH